MKLTDDQAQRIEAKFGAQPIPHEEPAAVQLREAFGDHTFYLDMNGLIIFEPTEEQGDSARAILLATWTGEAREELGGIEPQPTETVVDFSSANDS